MCLPRRRYGSGGHDPWGCLCACPATMSVREEIQHLEDHRRFLSEQVEFINKKVAALKSAQGS